MAPVLQAAGMNQQGINSGLLMKETTAAPSDRWDSLSPTLTRLPTSKNPKKLPRIQRHFREDKMRKTEGRHSETLSFSSLNESVNRYSREILSCGELRFTDVLK